MLLLSPSRDLIVDFNANGNANGNGNSTERHITLPMRWGFFRWLTWNRRWCPLLKAFPPRGPLEVRVELGTLPDGMQIEGLAVECATDGSTEYGARRTFMPSPSNTLAVSIIFHKECIRALPYEPSQPHTYTLPLRIIISSRESAQTLLRKNDSLRLQVMAVKVGLDFSYESLMNGSPIEYTGQDNIEPLRIGTLHVSHQAAVSFAPPVADASFSLETAFLEKDSTGQNTKTSTPLPDVLTLLPPVEDTDNINNVSVNGGQVTIARLEPGQRLDFPVMWNLQAVQHPPKSHEYPITVRQGAIANVLSWERMRRNLTLTQIKTTLTMPAATGGETVRDITYSGTDADMGLLIIDRGQESSTLHLTFRNMAEDVDRSHPDAAVLVWDVRIDDVRFTANAEGLKVKENYSVKDLFVIEVRGERQEVRGERCERRDESHEAFILNSREGNRLTCDFALRLQSCLIDAIIPQAEASETFADVELLLSYHAIEDVTGRYHDAVSNHQTDTLGETGLCHQTVRLRMKMAPQPEWLCVDFGTSAVVAAYARDIFACSDTLINLKEQKDFLLRQAYTEQNSVKASSADEEGAHLISSTICLNSKNQGDYRYVGTDGAEYMNYAVWFSPSANDIQLDYQLPCLKTIMGYRHLPPIFSHSAIENFTYLQDGEERHLDNNQYPIAGNREGMSLTCVDVVAEIVYRQLFSHYLTRQLMHAGGQTALLPRIVDKLVLSVPNTYTPLNIETLRRLARQSMPTVYPEYLLTVSESDAVACYYLSRENDFFDASELNRDLIANLRRKESVLVYDMGAGTLDLTWFTKETTVNADRLTTRESVTVNILGKMGINKAGNYLDYELATIIVDLLTGSASSHLSPPTPHLSEKLRAALSLDLIASIESRQNSQGRNDLKRYVRQLKPLLNHPDMALPPLTIEGEEVPMMRSLRVADIVRHPLFLQFIDSITRDVLLRFGRLFGKNENIKGKIDIDVVVFSGRSTGLEAIRRGVSEQIGIIRSASATPLLFADICKGCLNTDATLSTTTSFSPLKEVVTQGALAYANYKREGSRIVIHSLPLYATFGLVLHKQTGRQWIPLIGPDCPTTTDNNGVVASHEIMIQGDVLRVELVQSYSPDVMEDYQNKMFDSISKLTEFTHEGGITTVQLFMDNGVQGTQASTLRLRKGQGDGELLNPHDDFSNESLRKSLWPVIFVKE